MTPEEHYNEAKNLVWNAEVKRGGPGEPFDLEPWLKALVHATLALYRLPADGSSA